jgi:UDP-perosamine 4-acetyltransferase
MKRKVFLLGASGHAKMLVDAIESTGDWDIVCCLDSPTLSNSDVLGIPVELETRSRLENLQNAGCYGFVALGDNRVRMKLSKMLQDLTIQQPTIIHRSAVVSPSAQIGWGSVIMPGAVVGAACRIGSGVIVNTAAHIDHDGKVGDYCHIGPGCHIAGNVTLQEGSFLGVGTSIIPQVQIGKWSIAGAGSTVLRSIPDNEIWVGNPARYLKASFYT